MITYSLGNKPSGSPGERRATPAHLFALLTPAITIITLLFGGGLVLGILQALGNANGDLTTAHFTAVITDPDFLPSTLFSLYISGASTILASTISLAFALLFFQLAGKNKLAHFLLQIPLAIPHLAVGISALLLLAPSGFFARILIKVGIISSSASFPLLVNDKFSIGILLVYVWKEVPFITFMLLPILKNMGTELLEVGSTLNCTRPQRFFHIILPIIAPNLVSASLIVFAFTLGAFEVPYLLGQTYPMSLPVWAYRNFSDVDLLSRPEGIAIGILITMGIIFLIIVSQLILSFSSSRRVLHD